MFLDFFKYLKFLLKSTNQHGIHSPFVFSYLTKCLYKKPRKSKEKSLDVLLKSIAYFEFTKANVIGNSAYEKELQKHFPNLVFDSEKIDILVITAPLNLTPQDIFSKYDLHNDSLILVNDIHKNSETHALWLSIMNDRKISASIDMFYCGAIFLRKEQQKEHFTIRI